MITRGDVGTRCAYARITRRLAVLVLALLCSACAETSNVAVKIVGDFWRGPSPIDGSKLDPRYRYLRVTIEKNTTMMVLGEVDAHPAGPIEVWFSGLGEVLRLQQGRVVSLTGVFAEWPRVQWPEGTPDWALVLARGEAIEYDRLRDVMPGYRYGVRDRLRLRPVLAPARSQLAGVAPQNLHWFEEVMLSTTDRETLPPARYALSLAGGAPQVIYGEQCISPKLCFTWQRWAAGQ